MIIVKVFESGENREARVENAILRFLFPDWVRPKGPGEKKPPETAPSHQTPPGEKPELGIGN